MICETCGSPALPREGDDVVESTDGPVLWTRWQCVNRHWWDSFSDAVCAATSNPSPLSLAVLERFRIGAQDPLPS